MKLAGVPVLVLAGLFLDSPLSGTTANLYPRASIADFPRAGIPFTIEVDIQSDASPGVTASNVRVTNALAADFTLLACSIAPFVQLGNIYDSSHGYSFVSGGNNGNTVYFDAGLIPNGFYRPTWLTVQVNQPGTYALAVTVTGQGAGIYPLNSSYVYPVLVHSNGLFVAGGQAIVESSGSNAVFTVTLSPSNSLPVSVDFCTVDGTATAGQDYAARSGSLLFPPGVTNRTVEVPILDDVSAELPSQSFSLRLTNAVGAEISGLSEPNYVLDDEPPLQLSIADAAPVMEGDTATNLVFPLQLSGPSDISNEVYYSLSGALTGDGTLVFAPGTTQLNLVIPVTGDLTPQSNRVVEVNLWSYSLASLVRSNAQGLIVEDDGTPGKAVAMELSPVISPQIAGRPFPVTLTLKDCFDNPATNITVPVNLEARYQRNNLWQVAQSALVTNALGGVATFDFTCPEATTNAVVFAWCFIGTGPILQQTPSFKVLPTPRLYLTLPSTAAEGDGELEAAGKVSFTEVNDRDVLVSLTSADLQEIQVPSSVLMPAGQTTAVFNVTIIDDSRLDGNHSTPVCASAPYYLGVTNTIWVQDNESATLTLNLPASLSEAPGADSATATVFASSAPVLPIEITLGSSDLSELLVPGMVYLQAGQTSAVFTVMAPADSWVDGPQNVTVTAHVPNWTDAVATLLVQDANNTLSLALVKGSIAPSEGAGTLTNGLQVSAGGFVSNALTVYLASSTPDKVEVPLLLVIPAGQNIAYANLAFPDNSLFDGVQSATLSASAPGFAPGSLTLTVPDNDVHHLTFAPISTPQTSSLPFRVTLTAKDVNDVLLSQFSGGVNLSVVGGSPLVTMSPQVASKFTRGSWTGLITCGGWGTNLQLQATATNGMSGLSSPFNIPTPAWARDLRFSRVQIGSEGLRLFFQTASRQVYQLETATNLPPVWTQLGIAQPGTGDELSVLDSAPTNASRFYRLSVTPQP